jgi:peptidase C25-like protein
MPTDLSTLRNDQSIKLSVTVKSRLDGKYGSAGVQKIDEVVKRWIKADATRGIQTVHVHVDDSTEMNALGVPPISGEATPENIKQAIDNLWNKLRPTPHYLVLFGGEQIIPMFIVHNPSGWMELEERDKSVPTDNPYATHLPFAPSDSSDSIKSYLIPERPIGRIPDMIDDPDPAWLCDYLETAINWKPQLDSFYKLPYAICTAEAEGAATELIQKSLGNSGVTPFVCPPKEDTSTETRQQLSAGLHMIKCHGNPGDATFWGFAESATHTRENAHAAITSATLRLSPKPSTVVASMCCFGAQIFSPSDPNAKSPPAWPIASTYLRQGALGFIGSTMMAWVGCDVMGSADSIVQCYVKNVLAGESIGNALLASKQDYQSHYSSTNNTFANDEQKTLIEYVLLGDPSIYPVVSEQCDANLLAFQSRCRRRDQRAKRAVALRASLPTRSDITAEWKGVVEEMFTRAKKQIAKIAKGDIARLELFNVKPSAVQVKKVDAPLPNSHETRQSLEFYWRGKLDCGGYSRFCVLKAETDREGKVVRRVAVSYTS